MLLRKPRPLLHHDMGNKKWVQGLGQSQTMLQVSCFTSELLVAVALGALLLQAVGLVAAKGVPGVAAVATRT